jgi:hypothetical protein
VNRKEAAGGDGVTQFGRALLALNIDIICANSPQAKGRIERAFGTLQERMVKELRLAGVSSIAAANAWLPGFITAYNTRFGRDPANANQMRCSTSLQGCSPRRARRARRQRECHLYFARRVSFLSCADTPDQGHLRLRTKPAMEIVFLLT